MHVVTLKKTKECWLFDERYGNTHIFEELFRFRFIKELFETCFLHLALSIITLTYDILTPLAPVRAKYLLLKESLKK